MPGLGMIAGVSTALIVAGLLTALVATRVGPNRLFGIRTRAAFARREAWDMLNRRGGWGLVVAGGIFLLVAMPLAWLTDDGVEVPFGCLAVVMITYSLWLRRLGSHLA